MKTNQHPSGMHAMVHKMACATGLLVALGLGIPSFQVVSSRMVASVNLQAWCVRAGCLNVPDILALDPVVVYADKAAETSRVVTSIFGSSFYPPLDMGVPQIESIPRAVRPAAKAKESKR